MSFLNLPSFFHPVQNPLVEIIDLEAFLDEQFGSGATTASAPAIDGNVFSLVQQIVGTAGELFILYIDVEAARDVTFHVFGQSADIHQLYVRVLDQFLELGRTEVLVFYVLVSGTSPKA